MGEIYIGCGFIRGKLDGIYCDVLRGSLWSPGGGCGLVQGFGSTPTQRGRSFSVKKSSKRIFRSRL